jgi:hypothetical protein
MMALLGLLVLFLFGAFWFLAPSNYLGYLTNQGEAEFLSQSGLVSLIVLQNDVTVTDWLDMNTSHTVKLPPGKYQVNANCWRREVSGWEVTTAGLFADRVVRQRGTSCALDVQRGERVTVRPILRDVAAPQAAAVESQVWTQLFNGRDLTGWKTHPQQPGGWRVEDGILVGHAPDKPSHLFSERGDYQNFHFRIEAKISAQGDSGQFFRCEYGFNSPQGKQQTPLGYEANISSLNQFNTGSLWGAGWPPVGPKENVIAPDTWFTQEVIARDNHLVIKLNGKTTVDFIDHASRYSRGHLALQAWALGTVVYFRKVEVKELPATNKEGWVQLFDGKDLTGWETDLDRPGDWKVAGGILIGRGPQANELVTTRADFESFHLRVEGKINARGNSGIMFRRAPAQTNPGKGYEADIDPSVMGAVTKRLGTGTPIILGKPAPGGMVPDTWFIMEVIAEGDRLTVLVDGKTVSKVRDDGPDAFRRGSLGLQVYSPETVVQFRKIEIKKLPLSATAEPAAPFVILSKDGKAEAKFDSLADGVSAAQSGDTIEIRGDGPFVTTPISITDIPLTIRAAAGFRPVLKLADQSAGSDAPLLYANASLVLEGMELHRVSQKPWQPGIPLRCTVWSMKAPLRIANCLFYQRGGTVCVYSDKGAASCEVRNCAFLTTDGAVTWWPTSSGQLILENCLHPGYHALVIPYRGPMKDISVKLKRNTFVTESLLLLSLVNAGPEEKTALLAAPNRPISFDTSENILVGASTLLQFDQTQEFLAGNKALTPDEAESLLLRLIGWQDRQNLYGPAGRSYVMLTSHHFEPCLKVASWGAWRKLWGNANEAQSIHNQVFHRAGGLRARAKFSLDKLTLGEFRLADGSPGKGAGPGGKDLGADVDLVGPGAAYERWKKTPEYQDWLRKLAGAVWK